MENKYYTPEIEIKKYYQPDISEFHVGFEYEYEDINQGGASTSWYKGIIEPKQAYIIDQIYRDEDREYRVKYLDKEDIESLGFIKESIYSHKLNQDYYIEYNSEKPIHTDSIEIKNNQNTLFSGYIKNKSELKKLLKQLNIK